MDEASAEVKEVVVEEEVEEEVESAMKKGVLVLSLCNIVRSCIMPEDKALVDDGEVEDAEDVSVVVTDAEVVAPDVTEEEVEEEEEVVVVVVVEEEVEEDEDVVPSSEAPFLTVKMSLTAS